MWKVAHSRRAASIQATVLAKTSGRSWSKPSTKLPLTWMPWSCSSDTRRVVGRPRGLLAGVGEVLVRERLEADEDPRAARQRHLADHRGVVGHVDRHRGAPDHPQRSQGPAERPQVLGPRAEVVVDEHAVGLAVVSELGDDLLDVAHLVRHRQPVGGQVAEAAAVVATPGGDQAGRRQEAPSRQQVAAGGRVVAVGAAVAPAIGRPQRPRLDVAEDLRPDLHPLADRQRVGVRGGLLGARQDVQPAEHHRRPPFPIPPRQRVRPLGERQVDRDPDDLRERLPRRRALQQVLIPVRHLPVRRRRARDARQRQRRRQDVLAEAGVRVLRVERVDQQGRLRPQPARPDGGVERGGLPQCAGNPRRPHGRVRCLGLDRPPPVTREGKALALHRKAALALQRKAALSRYHSRSCTARPRDREDQVREAAVHHHAASRLHPELAGDPL